MPAIYAHFRLGEDVRKELDGEEAEAVEAYPELFRTGTHGPDILFYYRPLTHNAVSGLGHRMHAEAGSVFFERAAEVLKGGRKSASSADKLSSGRAADTLRNSMNCSAAYSATKMQECDRMTGEAVYYKETYDLASFAYVCGFLCHFALDVCCHGYIGDYIGSHGVSHAKIESELDRELMVRDGFDPVSHSIVGHLAASDENARIISRFYGRMPQVETEKEIKKALRSMIFYSGVLLAPSRAKRAVLNFGMNIIGAKGFQDMMIGLEKDPKCEESTANLIMKYGEAKKLALHLIRNYRRQFLEKEEEPDEIYRYNFESQIPS
ncbi:MAG: zinc dependent phospholipase C family protein [Lachnospiraceae bacterium]|nr:zinc dependent phospholipase C family protein [Lachnospiraceae bacterium]